MLVAGFFLWRDLGSYESTDDAQIDEKRSDARHQHMAVAQIIDRFPEGDVVTGSGVQGAGQAGRDAHRSAAPACGVK